MPDANAFDPLRAQLAMLARYNAWATGRLYEHVHALPEDEYRRDLGLFFKSVHGTLNHLLVAEHALWFRRFAHGESPQVQLNAELESDRALLKQRLVDGADAWRPFVEQLSDARLAGMLEYRTMRGSTVALPFAATLAHVFNHGTHHRAQITAGVTALGRTCPVLDLVFMLQQESVKT